MAKPKTQNRKTKKQNRKPKTQNRKTKKQNRKTTKKQKGGNNDELAMIIRDESLDALKEYVEQGGDVNKKGSKGITALMEAIAIQDKSKAQYLIEQGADVNATSDDGKTAYSIAFGNDELVDLLKNAGANTNPTYLLLLAIEHNNTQSAKAMLDNRETLGLNINEQVPQYKTIQQEEPIYEYPLTLAIKKDNLEIVKHLLEAGASLDIESDQTYDADTQITDNQETPIILAVKEQNDMMVDLLLEENLKRDIYNRFDINRTSDSNYTALYKAVEKGYSLITDQLLKAGANPNHHNGPNETTPIIKAAQNRDLDMVEILFDAGADPLLEDATGTDALYTAYNNNDIHIIDYFTAKDVEGASTLMSELEQDQFFNSSNQEEDDQEYDEAFPPPPPAQKTDMKTVVQQIQQAPITIPPFYDVVNMTDTDMKTYLDEDPDNIIFIYNQQIVGSDKARIQHEITTNRTKVMLECKDPNTYFHQPKENIVKDEQDNLLYYLNMDIIGLAGIFLPIAQLKTLTESSQSRTFFVSTLEDKQHKDGGHVVTSFSSYDGDSVVSGKHCAENEAIKFGKLHAI